MEYEKNQGRLKLCLFCDERIQKDQITCGLHREYEKLYSSEDWYLYLLEQQNKQYTIEIEEYRLVKQRREYIKKTNSGRGKQLTKQQKQEILTLYKTGIGDRKISKALGIPYSTVNKFLYRYRKDQKKYT